MHCATLSKGNLQSFWKRVNIFQKIRLYGVEKIYILNLPTVALPVLQLIQSVRIMKKKMMAEQVYLYFNYAIL